MRFFLFITIIIIIDSFKSLQKFLKILKKFVKSCYDPPINGCMAQLPSSTSSSPGNHRLGPFTAARRPMRCTNFLRKSEGTPGTPRPDFATKMETFQGFYTGFESYITDIRYN
jgi:hypothetical protein